VRTAKRPLRSVLCALSCGVLLASVGALHASSARATLISGDAAAGLGGADPVSVPFRDFWQFVADHLVPRVCGCFEAHDPRLDFDAPDLESQFANRWNAGHFDGFSPFRLFGDGHFRIVAFEIVDRLIWFEKNYCVPVVTPPEVPELGTGVLAASGLIGLALMGRRRSRS